MKKALITGITGQDGSYLAELLLSKGYDVHGIIRRSSTITRERIDHLTNWAGHRGSLELHYGDLSDSSSLSRILRTVDPDEIYNLGAQSHVKVSFEQPEYTGDVVALGTARLLEAILDARLTNPRYYQASSSEMFGLVQETPQTEKTPFHPRSPYAVAKLYAHWITVNYREAHGLHASCGILFNHESPRRGETFVTRKITRAVGRMVAGLQETLDLGNLDARRDWGYAADYVEGMWRMVQHDSPDDYVLATGETHTVREFVELAFRRAGLELHWEGKGASERGIDADGVVRVKLDERFLRPSEVDLLLGDASKARNVLGWKPATTFHDLVSLMVDSDVELARYERDNKPPVPR